MVEDKGKEEGQTEEARDVRPTRQQSTLPSRVRDMVLTLSSFPFFFFFKASTRNGSSRSRINLRANRHPKDPHQNRKRHQPHRQRSGNGSLMITRMQQCRPARSSRCLHLNRDKVVDVLGMCDERRVLSFSFSFSFSFSSSFSSSFSFQNGGTRHLYTEDPQRGLHCRNG